MSARVERGEVKKKIDVLAQRLGRRKSVTTPAQAAFDRLLAEWAYEPMIELIDRGVASGDAAWAARVEVQARVARAKTEAALTWHLARRDKGGVGPEVRATLRGEAEAILDARKLPASAAPAAPAKPAAPVAPKKPAPTPFQTLYPHWPAACPPEQITRVIAEPARKPETPADLAARIVKTARKAGAIR